MNANFKSLLRLALRPALLALGWCAAAGGTSAFAAAIVPPDFRQLPPLPALRPLAERHEIPLTRIERDAGRTGLRPGDRVTVIVSRTQGAELQQWLIALEAGELTADEAKRKPRSAHFYSSTGHEFRFGSGFSALSIRIAGPITARTPVDPSKTELKVRRVLVSSDFVALGLDRAPAATLRARAARAANPDLPSGMLELGSRPFPPEVISARKKAAEAIGITKDDERAVGGSVLALLEFFQVASRTPGLQEVLMSVLDLPWWSILRNGGKMPDVNFEGLPMSRELDGQTWGVDAATRVYATPYLLRLNGKAALRFQLAVTEPTPPLLVTAGVVGLAAARPNDAEPVLTLQIVAAKGP